MTQAESNHETLRAKILEQIKELKKKVNTHGVFQKINYGHVGDLTTVLDELQELNSFLTPTT